MKRLMLILSLASLGVSALASDQTAEFKKVMMSMKGQVEKAFMTKDINWFDNISTKDFTEKDNGKTYTKAQALAEMKQEMAMSKSITCKADLVSAKAANNVGTAVTKMNVTTITMPDAKGKTHKMTGMMTQKETWVKVGNTWKIKHIEPLKPPVMMMDGKPMKPAPMSKAG